MRRRSSEQSPLTRLTVRRALMMLFAVASLSLALAAPVAAQNDGGTRPECPADLNTVPAGDSVVRFVKVAGLIDPPVRDYMLDQLDRAEADPNTVGYLLWMNSNGSVLSDDDYLELATRLRESPVETALWVGNTGSTARGGAAELATVVDLIAVTPNSTIGRTGERRLPAEWGTAFGEAATRLETGVFTANQAIEAGISVGPLENTVPIGSFATMLSGFEVFECVNADGALATVPTTQPLLSGAAAGPSAVPHGGQPRGGLPPVRDGSGRHRVRALRGRRRDRRCHRCRIAVPRRLRPGHPAGQLVGAGAADPGHVFPGHRHPDQRAPLLHDRRAGQFRAGNLVPVRRRLDVVDHGPGRNRRRAVVRLHRHAVDGADTVLDADHRSNVDDRGDGPGAGRPSIPRGR